MRFKGILASALILGSLLAAGAGLYFWKWRASHRAQQAGFEPAESVELVEARTIKWRPTAELVGTAVALRSITLSNEIAGSVTEVLFESGSSVKAGDVLVRLNDEAERADLAAAEAAVRVAGANVRAAEANLHLTQSSEQRLTQAAEARAASSMDVDRAQADVASATATLDRMRAEGDHAKARAEQIRTMIAKKTLRAPFDAVAGLRNVHPGQYLAEGTTVVGLQGADSAIYIDFALPQDQVRRVKPGDVVMAQASVFGDEPVRIEVVAMDATADRTTRNVRIRSKVDNPGGALRPGMFVEVKAPVGEVTEYVAAPVTAVRRAAWGDHVFVVAEDPTTKQMRAAQRFVRLGPTVGQETIVLEGLQAGERLAAAGSFKLRDGALIMPAPPPAAPGTPGAPGTPAAPGAAQAPGESPATPTTPASAKASDEPRAQR